MINHPLDPQSEWHLKCHLNGNCHVYYSNVRTILTVDKAGRIVLPKPIGDALQIVSGDSLEPESSEDGIMLRPARGTAQIRKKQGVWILHGGAPLSPTAVKDTVGRVRSERERRFLGKPQ